MGPITSIIPTVRVLACAGRRFRVKEFTLRDLAELQAILDELSPDPLAAIQDGLSSADPETRRKLLVAAHELAEAGPAIYGQDSGQSYFATPVGASLFLWVALRRRNKGITPALAATLWADCTASEYGRIWRVCHGTTPLRAIERLLLVDAPQGGGGPKKTWPELIDELACERGWTYGQIYDLTVTEWVYARNGGELPESGVVVRNWNSPRGKENLKALGDEQKRLFYGAAEASEASGRT